MKKTPTASPSQDPSDELRPEYHFDYRQARPNRFAGRSEEERLVVVLDPDVAEVFDSPEAVNKILRALIANMPPAAK